MSDDSTDGRVITFPGGGDTGYVPPPIPLYRDTAPEPEAEIPPATLEETTLELPVISTPAHPRTFLASEGIPADSGPEDFGEDWEGEEEYADYSERRSLADRIGDWLEYRIALGRSRMEAEGPFREAEIADKVARMQAQTSRETGLMEQHNKLRQAHMQAQAARAAAQGKADAAGLGADKSLRKSPSGPVGGGTNGRAGGPGPSGGGRGGGPGGPGPSGGRGSGSGGFGSPGGSRRGGGSGTNSGATGKGSGASPGGSGSGGRGSGSTQHGSGGPSGGRNGAGRDSESGGGLKGRQGGSGSFGGAGAGGQQPLSPAAERSRGRQERRSARQAADLADRTSNRDQARGRGQIEWEDRRARAAERRAKREAKREAKRQAAGEGRVGLGQALAEEAERRWDKRRAERNSTPDPAKADPTTKPKAPGAADTAPGTAEPPKVDLTKKPKAADPGPAAGGSTKPDPADTTTDPGSGATAKPDPAGTTAGPAGAAKPGSGTSGASGPSGAKRPGPKGRTSPGPGGGSASGTGDGWIGFLRDVFEQNPHAGPNPEPEFVSAGNPDQPPRGKPGDDDIPDAEIVVDALPATGPAALEPAPERHTKRPGTSRPTSTEKEATPMAGQQNVAAQHATEITFDEYLVEIANIAVSAAEDKQEAEDLAEALTAVAAALRDMATDLIGDHNIATEVTELIANLADSAEAMAGQAQLCAAECEQAAVAAAVAARSVAQTYGEDVNAMEAGGLTQASAAAHH